MRYQSPPPRVGGDITTELARGRTKTINGRSFEPRHTTLDAAAAQDTAMRESAQDLDASAIEYEQLQKISNDAHDSRRDSAVSEDEPEKPVEAPYKQDLAYASQYDDQLNSEKQPEEKPRSVYRASLFAAPSMHFSRHSIVAPSPLFTVAKRPH